MVASNSAMLVKVPRRMALADDFPGDLGEETLDLVQPGRRGRREVGMEPRVLFQPLFDLGMLVCGVVVDDQMDVERLGQLAFEPAREGKVLLMAVALHALADDPAVEQVQGREQRGRTVTFVIVCHGPRAARLDRQAGLSAVERLDLAGLS